MRKLVAAMVFMISLASHGQDLMSTPSVDNIRERLNAAARYHHKASNLRELSLVVAAVGGLTTLAISQSRNGEPLYTALGTGLTFYALNLSAIANDRKSADALHFE